MSNRATVLDNAPTDAARAFVDRAVARFEEEFADLYVFGCTVRGDVRGLASDVDVLVVLDAESNHEATADMLRDIAYDVMLEYGPVVEFHALTDVEFRESLERGTPFVETAVAEGRSYV